MVKNERRLTTTDDGGAEIDADAAFKQILAVIDDVLAKSNDVDGTISHVASCSFWHSLVGIDANNRPTTKVFGWADTRSRAKTEILKKHFDEKKIHNRTGAHFHSSFWTSKLLWLRTEYPTVWKRTASWISLSDYANLKLTGALSTSVSMASATGIFDQRKCVWDDELLTFLRIDKNNLPAITAKDSDTFSLSQKFAKRWPRLKDAKWFPAIGDGAANNIGAGCLEKGRAALMIGTSAAMRMAYRAAPPAKIPQGLWCYRIDRSRIIIGGALSDGGGLYRWLKENLRLLADDDKTEAEVAKRVPAAHGLVFVPFLAGERSTGYNENARGAIIGLRSSTDTIDIVQAALESVAFRFSEIFTRLDRVSKIRDVIASGGALRESPVWTQIIADVLNCRLTLPDTREASSRGAVLWALAAAGKDTNLEKLIPPKGKTFRPSKKKSAVYQAAAKIIKHDFNYLIEPKPID